MAELSPSGPATNRAVRGWLALALVTTLPIWWLHAIPVASLASAQDHAGHFALVYGHMLGGTVMLFVGAAAVFIGVTRRAFAWHRVVGGVYLVGGSLGAAGGLALSVLDPHGTPGITLATGTLAATWLAIAALAFRAARNRRYATHRDCMIRSYVLTWTFVGCRIAMRVPALAELGDPGGAGLVWAAWIVPLLACEVALQWRGGSRATTARDPS